MFYGATRRRSMLLKWSGILCAVFFALSIVAGVRGYMLDNGIDDEPSPITETPTPTAVVAPTDTFIDRNCGDFATKLALYEFYFAAGGPGADPHGLDEDQDGILCEDRFGNLNCSDFRNVGGSPIRI